MQLLCKYGDFLKCKRFTRRWNFCLGWSTVIFCGALGGWLNAHQEKRVGKSWNLLYSMQNKIAGHACAAGNANQKTQLCEQQLNVGLCAWHNQSCFHRNHSLLQINVSFSRKKQQQADISFNWSCWFYFFFQMGKSAQSQCKNINNSIILASHVVFVTCSTSSLSQISAKRRI